MVTAGRIIDRVDVKTYTLRPTWNVEKDKFLFNWRIANDFVPRVAGSLDLQYNSTVLGGGSRQYNLDIDARGACLVNRQSRCSKVYYRRLFIVDYRKNKLLIVRA